MLVASPPAAPIGGTCTPPSLLTQAQHHQQVLIKWLRGTKSQEVGLQF